MRVGRWNTTLPHNEQNTSGPSERDVRTKTETSRLSRGARLAEFIKKQMDFAQIKTFFCSDSVVALSWIKRKPVHWKSLTITEFRLSKSSQSRGSGVTQQVKLIQRTQHREELASKNYQARE